MPCAIVQPVAVQTRFYKQAQIPYPKGKMAKTFENDEKLPNLPVSPLNEAFDLYLESVRALVNDDNALSQTETALSQFKDDCYQLYDDLVAQSKERRNWVGKFSFHHATFLDFYSNFAFFYTA